MFDTIRQRFADMATIKALATGAEAEARADQQRAPGAEHFLLAALELPDRTAERALARLGVDREVLRRALAEQHRAALQRVGIDAAADEASRSDLPPLPKPTGLYDAAPSGQEIMVELAALRKQGHEGPLLGAHVALVIGAMQHGIAARALTAAGVSGEQLVAAARAELGAAAPRA
jgi:ATP-dependent Clp protease ATP-binding subunit ClpA